MRRRWWLVGLLLALAAALLSPLASSSPDGLERVALDLGFLGLSASSPYRLLADYAFPGVEGEALAGVLAGVAGVLLVFGVTLVAARLFLGKGPHDSS